MSLLAALAGLPFAAAHADDPNAGKTAYWCKHDNGSEFAQLEPCAPGMEVSRGVIGADGLIPGKAVEPIAVPGQAAQPADNARPAAAVPGTPAQQLAPDAAKKSDADVLHEGQMSLLKLLGFGLLFGVIAKLRGRSFFGWFILGAIVRIVLVSANLMKF